MGLMNKRTLLLGGLAVAAVAGALKNRERVAGLIGSRSSASEPPSPSSATYAAPEQTRTPVPDEPAPAPEPSNYDLAGPAENTATKLPAPEPQVTGGGGIDEEAEEAAAAAEAAAIGGQAPDYAGTELGEPASEETAPVAEAGGGESEGQEQAEALLADNAEPAAGDPIDAERRIQDVADRQEQPAAGETVEPLVREDPRAEAEQAALGTDRPAQGLPERGFVAEDQGVTDTSATTREDVEAGAEPEPTAPADTGGTEGDASTGALGGGQASFFAGGKGSETAEPETASPEEAETAEGAGAGLPDQGAADAAERAASETPAEQKSSAVWEPAEKKKDEDAGQDDDTGEWQTWSGRAVDP